ncbi:MAG: glycosyltransferase family 4 protein [Candidatus Thiodiazotropha sp.]
MIAVRSEKLKFIFVLNEPYPPFRVDTTVLFGEEMVRRGHRIKLVMQSKDNKLTTSVETWNGCDVLVISNRDSNSIFSKIVKNIEGLSRGFHLFKLLKEKDWQFVQVRDLFVVGAIALLAAKIRRKQFFFWLSFPVPEMHIYRAKNKYAKYPSLEMLKGRIFKFILYKIIAKYSDHIFVQSDKMKQDMQINGVKDDKMTPIYMGISKKHLDYYKTFQRVKKSDGIKRIVYLGTLDKARRLDFLIRVHAMVVSKCNNVELYFVGGGIDTSDEELLRKEARRLGVENSIVFTGYVNIDTALQYVKESDVGLSPYYPTFIYNSTSPTKLIEYMALRCPVVANTHPEQTLIINESGAGLCVPWEEKEFADAILHILNNPDVAEEMGRRGYEYVSKHRSYSILADKLEAKYFELQKIDAPT